VSVCMVRGISFPCGGRAWGLPIKFLRFLPEMAHFGCIFCHTRDLFAVQREGGPSGPMVNTPMLGTTVCLAILRTACAKM